MSVNNSDTPRIRELRGWNNPSLPIGFWAAQRSIVGDASGGQRQIEILFNSSGAARSSVFYSLEQIYVTDTNNVTKVGSIESLSMDGVGDLILNWAMSAPLTSNQVSARMNADDAVALRGIWLGRQPAATTAPRLRYLTSNINGSTLLLVVQGYMWSSRSILAEGGPQRPIQGLYRP